METNKVNQAAAELEAAKPTELTVDDLEQVAGGVAVGPTVAHYKTEDKAHVVMDNYIKA